MAHLCIRAAHTAPLVKGRALKSSRRRDLCLGGLSCSGVYLRPMIVGGGADKAKGRTRYKSPKLHHLVKHKLKVGCKNMSALPLKRDVCSGAAISTDGKFHLILFYVVFATCSVFFVFWVTTRRRGKENR